MAESVSTIHNAAIYVVEGEIVETEESEAEGKERGGILIVCQAVSGNSSPKIDGRAATIIIRSTI